MECVCGVRCLVVGLRNGDEEGEWFGMVVGGWWLWLELGGAGVDAAVLVQCAVWGCVAGEV